MPAMDEKALNELLECSVCLDRLDASSKVLPCQHTFCRWCLEEIISTKKELRCPECRYLVETKIQDLPTNILLVRLLEGMKNAARSSGSSNKSSPSRASDRTTSGPASPVHNTAEGGTQSEQYKIIDLSNQPCAKALYNYDATEPGDLSFKKGDIILLRKQVDENWFHGELQGQQGFFPASYVQIVNPMSNKEIPSCKALYDFTDQNEKDCLTFQKDETLTVIRRIDDNWIEGKLGDNIGIFPKSFVEFNDAAKLLINYQASLVNVSQMQMNDLNNQTRTRHVPSYANLSASVNPSASLSSTSSSSSTSSTSVASHQLEPRLQSSPTNTISTVTMPHVTTGSHSNHNKRHSLTTSSPARTTSSQPTNRHSLEVPVTSGSSPWSATTTLSASNQPSVVKPVKNGSEGVPTGHTSPGSSVSVFVALYAYKPEKDDEIELHKGEFYSVTEKCQDGWYKGFSLSTGISGVFPGNYVQPIQITSAKPNTSRSTSCMSALSAPAQVNVTSATNTLHVTSLSTSQHSQIGVTRTHSFPKTSILASLNSDVRMRLQGAAGQKLAVTHSRPITNITQAQIRSTQSALGMSLAQSLAHGITIPTSPVMSTGYSTAHPQTAAVKDEAKTQSLPCGIRAHQVYQNSQLAMKETLSSVSKTSPKSSKRHTLTEKANKHTTTVDDCQPTHYNCNSSSDQLHSTLAANTNATPPHVIGATGGSSQNVTANKDKEKKKEKERLPISIMKKISAGLPMRVRKSKSPILDGSKDVNSCSSCHQPSSNAADVLPSASSPSSALTKPSVSSSVHSHNHTHHHRSGSAPGCSPSRSAASSMSSHRKSSSVDSAQHSSGKTGKAKFLVRERYQCIVPYPPQSDIELELKPGDIVYVHKKREDGWYKGILQSSGKMGLFPGSFVEKA